MGLFFKNNDFKTDYKKRPFDGYKATVDKLDEETKRKLDHQRTIGMVCIVAFVVILVLILYFTGIGVDKTKSISGNVFVDKEQVLIECFGDSVTEGYTGFSGPVAEVTYPKEVEKMLPGLFHDDGRTYKFSSLTVKNYGQAGSILQAGSSSRLSGMADIVIIQYTANNFLDGTDYVDTLESNIGEIQKQGAQVFLVNYAVLPGSESENKIDQANHYIASAAESMQVRLIDLKSYFSSLPEEEQKVLFSEDGLHLTQEGYIRMGDQISDFIHTVYFEME